MFRGKLYPFSVAPELPDAVICRGSPERGVGAVRGEEGLWFGREAVGYSSRDTMGNRERFGRFVVSVWGTACEQGPREGVQPVGKDVRSFLTSWGCELHVV